jgi:asparaginyl-tRNA synthetase
MEKLSLSDTLYVCEVQGSDETGKGNESSPFKSPIRALEVNESAKILVRKALQGEEAGFKEISGAGLKKAKKGLELLKKKLVKEQERSAKEADQAAEEQRRLEESKAIQLVQDTKLPVARKVNPHYRYPAYGL